MLPNSMAYPLWMVMRTAEWVMEPHVGKNGFSLVSDQDKTLGCE